MPPRWNEYRKVIGRNGFELKRSGKHVTWVQLDEDGRVLRHTTVSHGNAAIRDRGFFKSLLKQCGKTEAHFFEVLKGQKPEAAEEDTQPPEQPGG